MAKHRSLPARVEFVKRRAVLTTLLLVAPVTVGRGDELARASWDWPTSDVIQNAVDEWLLDQALPPQAQKEIKTIWDAYQAHPSQATNAGRLFDAVVDTIAIARPDCLALIQRARQAQLAAAMELEQIDWANLPPVVADNLRLLFGKSLTLSQLYDDAQAVMAPVDLKQVADPAAWLFYRAVVHHRLREKEAGLKLLRQLRERESELPDRYASLTQLMQVDLQQLKPDSLDEVARIMDSVKIRLGHGHAGTRVRQEEQDVVDKLDKMIEQLEQQLAQMQMAQGSIGGGLQSNSPAQDSAIPGGARGQGDVDVKQLGDNIDWGNLPPKQREEAIQQLGKEFPSHYRDIIEEYFRKLAQDNQRDE